MYFLRILIEKYAVVSDSQGKDTHISAEGIQRSRSVISHHAPKGIIHIRFSIEEKVPSTPYRRMPEPTIPKQYVLATATRLMRKSTRMNSGQMLAASQSLGFAMKRNKP